MLSPPDRRAFFLFRELITKSSFFSYIYIYIFGINITKNEGVDR